MSWLALLVLPLIAVLLQCTVCQFIEIPLVHLDLPLVLALVYGLAAPLPDARLGAWIVGLGCDLFSEGPLGLCALAYGLAALLLTKWRGAVNAQLWWVRLLIAFAGALPGQLLIALHLRFVQAGHVGTLWGMFWAAAALAAPAALLAALITQLPPLLPRRHGVRRPVWARR